MYNRAWSRTFLHMAPACMATGALAAYWGQYDTAVGEVAVCLTSVLHWRNPQPGWARWRMLDMMVVPASLAIHLHAMWWTAGAAAAFWVMALAMGCFGWSLMRGSYEHHAIGWVAACVSNVLLAYARTT